jgi:hypothetical protein
MEYIFHANTKRVPNCTRNKVHLSPRRSSIQRHSVLLDELTLEYFVFVVSQIVEAIQIEHIKILNI